MAHRFSTWWRALSVVLLSLATVTWPSGARASATSTFALLHQDPVAGLSARGTGAIELALEFAPHASHVTVQVSLYAHLIQRSQLAAVVSGVGPPGAPLSSSRALSVTCATTRPVNLIIGLYTRRPGHPRSPCTASAPEVRLRCHGGACDGVYPIRLRVDVAGAITTKWSLLAVQTTRVLRPLQVIMLETVGPSALAQPSRTVSALESLAAHPQVPVTLSGNYVALSAAQQSGSTMTTLRAALVRALASPLHQVVSAPPVSIDFAGLDASGLRDQVVSQLALSAGLVKSATGRYVAGPVLLGAHTTLGDLVALSRAKVSDVIVPEAALSYAPSSTLAWGAPFHVTGVPTVSALSTDEALSSLARDRSIEPGRRAALVLGTLALLHFEAPNALAPRAEILATPIESTSRAFLDALFATVVRDPFAQLASLAPSFSSSLIATNGAPQTRTLGATRATPRWSSHNVSSLTSLIAQITSYSQAVTSAPVANALRVALARAEIVGPSDARQNAINAASDRLERQVSNFSVDPSAITLAGPGTALPITLFSRANYTVTAVVHLITPNLSFPKGSNLVTTLNSSTTSLRVPTDHHRGSNLILQVVVTTPDDQVVLARAAIPVRIAGTSIVGYLLSFASLAVLALWWWRTYRRRSKGRHAR